MNFSGFIICKEKNKKIARSVFNATCITYTLTNRIAYPHSFPRNTLLPILLNHRLTIENFMRRAKGKSKARKTQEYEAVSNFSDDKYWHKQKVQWIIGGSNILLTMSIGRRLPFSDFGILTKPSGTTMKYNNSKVLDKSITFKYNNSSGEEH